MNMKPNASMAYQTSVKEIVFVMMAGLVTDVISVHKNAHLQCAVELDFALQKKIRNLRKISCSVIVKMDSLETNVKLYSAIWIVE